MYVDFDEEHRVHIVVPNHKPQKSQFNSRLEMQRALTVIDNLAPLPSHHVRDAVAFLCTEMANRTSGLRDTMKARREQGKMSSIFDSVLFNINQE